MASTMFKSGDKVVRDSGLGIYIEFNGEFATVVDDSNDLAPTGIVTIVFDNKDLFGGKTFKSYRNNIRLIERSDLFETDE